MYHVICSRTGLAGILSGFLLLSLTTAASGLQEANSVISVPTDGDNGRLLEEIIRAAAGLSPIKRVKRDGYEGGSFGGEGGESGGGGIIQNILLQTLLSQMASSSAPAPAPAPAPAAAASSDPGAAAAAPAPAGPNPLLSLLPLLMGMMGGGGGDDDPNALRHAPSPSNGLSADGMCSDLPFDAVTAYNSTLSLAFRHNRVYLLSDKGQILSPHVYSLHDLFPTFPLLKNITAALSFQGYFHLFSSDKYVKFPLTSSLTAKPRKVKLINADFPGVPVPVTAAFSMDNTTAVFLSGKTFVLYQPANERKVSQAFTPSVAERFSGLTTAFASQSGTRRFLVNNKTLTEIDFNFKVLQVSPFTRSNASGSGWLECPY